MCKKRFLAKFKDGQKKGMGSFLLHYLSLKENLCREMDDLISKLPKNNNVNCSLLMTILRLKKLACLK